MSGGDFIGRQERALCLARGVDDRVQVVRDMRQAKQVNPAMFRAGLPRGCVPDAVAARGQAVTRELMDHLYGDSTRGRLRPVFRTGVDADVDKLMAAARGERRGAAVPVMTPVPSQVPRAAPMPDPKPVQVVQAELRLGELITRWGGKALAARAIGVDPQQIYMVSCTNPRPISGPLAAKIMAADMPVIDWTGGDDEQKTTDAGAASFPPGLAGDGGEGAGGAPEVASPPPSTDQAIECLAGGAADPSPAPGQTGEAAPPSASPTPAGAGGVDLGRAIAEVAACSPASEPTPDPSREREGRLGAALAALEDELVEARADWQRLTGEARVRQGRIDALQRAIDALRVVA